MALNRYSLKHVNEQLFFWQINVNFCSTHYTRTFKSDWCLDCYINVIPTFSMTQLLSHTFAHLIGPSFRLKAKLLPNKKYLGLTYTCIKVVEIANFWLSKSIFYIKNYPNLSIFFFTEEYQFRSTLFVIDIFWQLQFLKHFIL